MGGFTPLSEAARAGRLETVRLLLDRGAKIHLANKYAYTPLHVAAQWGRPRIVKLLLKRGADPFKKTVYGQTAVDILLSRHDELYRSPSGWNAYQKIRQMLDQAMHAD